MIRNYLACVSVSIVGILSKGLVVEEVGDLVHHSHPMGPFEITRYPHYEIIKENIRKQEGSLDYTLYINQLPEEAEGSEHLTDLPDELQQLQQQLLEASRVEVHSHDVEVDNSTGWPWYMATIPPGDFYDCLFLYFSCTDYEEPAWPGNKEKCTNLFDYCITYTEKNANSTDPKDPFVTKIPISSEIITTRPKPSTPTITIELPSSESTSGQKPDEPAASSEEPKPSSEKDPSEENSNENQVSTEASGGKPESSSKSPVEPIASSESPSSTTESSDSSQEFSEKPTSSETPPAISSEQPIDPEEPQVAATQNPTNSPVSSEEPATPDSSSQNESSPESTSELIVSSTTPSTTESAENAQNFSENPDEPSDTPQSTEVSEPQNKPQTQQETQKPTDSSSTQVSSEATTSSLPTSSTESPLSSTEVPSPATVGAQNQNAIVSGLPIPTKPSKPSVTTETSDVPEASSEPQKQQETESPTVPQADTEPSVTPISTTESSQSSESPSSSELPSSSESPSSSETPQSSESPSSSESSVSSSEKPVSQETSSEAPSSSTVGAENQNAQVSGLPTPSPPKPASSSKPTPPKRPKKKPASCADLYTLKGIRESGTYPILVAGENITVYCDMETRGGGWTVLQRRGDFDTKEDYFLRKWDAYKQGFGNPEEDHWVGLKFWNNITLSTPQQLLIEMEDWFGNKTEIVVNNFIIGTEFFKFRIIYASIDGEFGESLPKKGTKFSTLDNDNDAWRNNCASRFKGAWWYSACHNSNLNGLYLKGEHESFGNGVNWYHWTGYHYSLKKTEMKVRVQSKAVTLGFLQNKKT